MSKQKQTKSRSSKGSQPETPIEQPTGTERHGCDRQGPTVELIARLATSLIAPASLTPEESVKLAWEVWKESAQSLERQELINLMKSEDLQNEESCKGQSLKGADLLLREIGGKTFKERRQLFRKFLKWWDAHLFGFDGEMLDPESEKEMRQMLDFKGQPPSNAYEKFSNRTLTPLQCAIFKKQTKAWKATLNSEKARAGYDAMMNSKKRLDRVP